MKTVISTPKAPAAIGPYSQAIRKGGTLYLSGQIGMVPATGELVSNDVKEQAAQALANMKAVLAEAGAMPRPVPVSPSPPCLKARAWKSKPSPSSKPPSQIPSPI